MRWLLSGGLMLVLLNLAPGQGPAPKVVPKLEPIAETKLLMDGLALANFRGVEKLLRQRPQDEQSWLFARGQALLLAETGNLLMLRPPKNAGEPVWFQHAMEFRGQAGILARLLAARDFDRAQAHLGQVAASCNRCHESFRVPIEITIFEQPLPKAE